MSIDERRLIKVPGTLRFQKIVILDSLKITNISKKKLKLSETLRSQKTRN